MDRGWRWPVGLLLVVAGCAPLPTTPAVPPPVATGAGFLVGSERPLTLPEGWQQQAVLPGLRAVQAPLAASDTALATLRRLPGVEYAEPNAKLKLVSPVMGEGFASQTVPSPYVPNDPDYPGQWNMTLSTIDRAWNLTKGLKGIKVGVVDSGIDPDHPDLKANLLPMVDVWKDVHGSDRFRHGGRLYDMDGKDGNGHGTHVTGILAASIDNGLGIAGTAGEVQILPIKATDYQGNTDALTLARAIKRAVDDGCRVINVSIGGDGTGDPDLESLRTTVDFAFKKGVVIVAATGNESSRSRKFIRQVTLPAGYPGAIAVAAVTQFDKVAEYSNGGPQVSIAAPGGGGLPSEGRKVRSTLPTYPTYMSLAQGMRGQYGELSGTSMACPHVSGVVALLLAREPHLTPQQICRRLALTADDVGTKGFDQETGFGRLNAYRALTIKVE